MYKSILIILISLGLFFVACEEKIFEQDSELFSHQSNSSCVGCHIDKNLLAIVADSLENEGGESGEG